MTSCALISGFIDQPTTRRENRSIAAAMIEPARHVQTWVKSAIHLRLGWSAVNWRSSMKRGPCVRSREDEAIMPAVRASFVASARTYGARRIWRDVLEAGFSCGLHKIERLMRSQALRAATQARPAERRRRTLGLGDRAECASVPGSCESQSCA